MPEPQRLAIVGYGKMGRMIEQLAPEYGFAVALKLDEFNNANFEGLTAANFRGIDVAIDFSIPSAVQRDVEGIGALGVNMVVGTTGWRVPARGTGFRLCARRRTGLEPELFGRGERIFPPGARGRASAGVALSPAGNASWIASMRFHCGGCGVSYPVVEHIWRFSAAVLVDIARAINEYLRNGDAHHQLCPNKRFDQRIVFIGAGYSVYP